MPPFGSTRGARRRRREGRLRADCVEELSRCRGGDDVIHFPADLAGDTAMMGVQAAAARLFYDFCLDDHVPVDHQLRGIDRHLSLDEVRSALKPFYSNTGRPSVDPELLIRMLLVGYCMGIRSERRLCAEVHLNLALLCRVPRTG